MRDRLIELFKKTDYNIFPDSTVSANLANQFSEYALNDIVDKLLKNGVIVPPCKVGDIVKCDAIYYEVYRMATYSDFETPPHHRFWAEPINDDGEDDFRFWGDEVKNGTVIVSYRPAVWMQHRRY